MTEVLLADDHPKFLEGLQSYLTTNKSISIVGTALNGKEALHLLRNSRPEIAILDIEMPAPDGFQLAQIVLDEGIQTRIILLTLFNDPIFVKKGFSLGIKGYLLKEDMISEINSCIRDVSEGKYYLSAQIKFPNTNSIFPTDQV